MGKVLSILNNKGGTGKTTTVLNLGAALSKEGRKVLMIDLDSQCNLSTSVGIRGATFHIGTYLLNQSSKEQTIVPAEHYDFIPSSDNLLDFEMKINAEPGREYILKESIENLSEQYDFTLIDCPPSLGTISINALVASDLYLVPMQAENFAFIGLDRILQVAEKVKKRMNAKLEMAGIVFVKMSHRTKFSQAVMSNIENNEELKKKVFKTIIRQDISLMESSAFSKNVYQYAPKGRGAADYTSLAKEILKKYGKNK